MNESFDPTSPDDRKRLRQLHHRNPFWTVVAFCNHCEEDWPCTMVRALDELDTLRTQHAEWATRATIYHEMLLAAIHEVGPECSGVVLDPDAIEREVAERMERTFTAANTLAALSN